MTRPARPEHRPCHTLGMRVLNHVLAIFLGEVQPFRVTTEMFNYQYLGATSTPKVEITVTDYEY